MNGAPPVGHQHVVIEKKRRVATVTINRPEAMNALNEAVILEIESALNELQDDDQTRAIVITGAGEKAFVAGADIAAMRDMDQKQAKAFSQLGQRLMTLIENHAKPVIAAINGYALGGGCEIALACDIRIASENAKLGQPEINLGIMCGYGATQRLTRLIGKGKAKELAFTGDLIDAASAEKLGLVNKVVPAAELMAVAGEFAEKLAAKPALALSSTKRAINKADELSLSKGLNFEAKCFAECFQSDDQKEGMDAFLNKRKPVFQ
jgi:enoyl-CoA hydratase